uniref:Ankyrin repeat domain-containing protein 33B-like n=1 Tax=Sinocyclocheilus anshuiensis TaxID=1608454 RepID=A0A671K9W7_9TELE
MKAAMQGRAECVRSLIMTGGDIEARDFGRKLTPREWALFTGRYETARLMARLMEQPCAEQFCDSYHMEWPMLSELVARSKEPKSCWRKFSECVCNLFTISMKTNPVDEGAMDYMVRMTTALASPFIATACHTVCPGSPPCVGKRLPARLFQNSRVTSFHIHPGASAAQDFKRLVAPTDP